MFVLANECTRVVPMYPAQSAMSHLHSLAPSMYIASFLPKHVIPTRFADYVTSTSGATRLAFDLLPLASSDAYPSFRLKAYIAGGKFPPNIGNNHKQAMSSRHSIPYTFYPCFSYTTDALVYVQSV